MIKGAIKDWGRVFFFNYNRINADIGNQLVASHVGNLFGKKGTEAPRKRLPGLSSDLRIAGSSKTLPKMTAIGTGRGSPAHPARF